MREKTFFLNCKVLRTSFIAALLFLFIQNAFSKNQISDPFSLEIDFSENSVTIDIAGFTLSEGIEYIFKGNVKIQAGGSIVLSNDTILFKNTYEISAFAQFDKQLSNKGETVLLKNGFNQLIDSVTYSDSDPWPEIADGDGYSIELLEPLLDNSLTINWIASEKKYGSPILTQNNKLDLNVSLFPNPLNDINSISEP